MNREEINLLLSSDSTQGAFNKSSDGAYFEIQLQEGGIQVPKNAKSCFLSCEESSIWWVIPNVITDVNDKIYITGPSGIEEKQNHELGYDQGVFIEADGSTFRIFTSLGNVVLPSNIFQIGDIVKVETTGEEYPIGTIIVNTNYSFQFSTTNTTVLAQNHGNFSRIRGGNGVNNYILTLPQGLYDLNLLNTSLITQLQNQGASSTTEPIISFQADNASQRVQIRLAYPSSSIDFTQPNNIRSILGFESNVYGPFLDAPKTITAENAAAFNQVNYFLVHTDLCSRGIRFNNQYSQVVSQVLIDRAPGSQIISKPYNPPKINVNELIGSMRTSIRVWLTDDKNRRVNTNGENYSIRLVLTYNY